MDKPRKSVKKKKPLTVQDILKYEIAKELGLLEKVKEYGWGGLTARETGKIGGIMTSIKRKKDRGETDK